MRILLVEDDAQTAAFIAKGLHEDGHAVDHAPDGKQGLFLASTERFDVIVLDRMRRCRSPRRGPAGRRR